MIAAIVVGTVAALVVALGMYVAYAAAEVLHTGHARAWLLPGKRCNIAC